MPFDVSPGMEPKAHSMISGSHFAGWHFQMIVGTCEQTMFLGTKSEMSQMSEVARKIKKQAAPLARFQVQASVKSS